MQPNPYSSPEYYSNSKRDLLADPSLSSLAKQTFRSWEKLRVLYVIVLGLITVLIAGANVAKLNTMATVVVGALIANLCFFLGPIVETYVIWLGYRGGWFRVVLFVAGTLLSIALAIAALH